MHIMSVLRGVVCQKVTEHMYFRHNRFTGSQWLAGLVTVVIVMNLKRTPSTDMEHRTVPL